MEVTGRVIKILPLVTGTGKNGIWKKQEFVLETTAQISKKICFSLWGEKIDQANLMEGDEAEVMFDLESREYNGRWFTEARAWKVVRKSGAPPVPPGEEPPPPLYEPVADDDMPF